MKKTIILVILLGIAWLGMAILFPNKNKSVKIKELNYASLFNDQNGVQLKSAAQFGIKQPLKNRDAADDMKKIVEDGLAVRDGAHLKVKDKLPLKPYLIWTATWENVGLDNRISTPKIFTEKANMEFKKRCPQYE